MSAMDDRNASAEHSDGAPHGGGGESAGLGGAPKMALWKKSLALVALLFGVIGVASGGMTAGQASPATETSGSSVASSGAGANLVPNSLGGGTLESAPGAGDEGGTLWAPLLAKGGLSFFIAFCIGYALRTFLKGTMLVVGVTALAVFGLQKAGILGEIDWDKAQGYWDDLTANLGRQFESLKAFVTGSLPSAASGGVGLVAGFRR